MPQVCVYRGMLCIYSMCLQRPLVNLKSQLWETSVIQGCYYSRFPIFAHSLGQNVLNTPVKRRADSLVLPSWISLSDY